MKKYIVYDGIVYEIKINEKYKKEGIINYYYIQTSSNTRLLFEKNDLEEYKQADSIEELCDEFVITKNNEGIQFWKDLNALKQCSGYFVQNDFNNVYGAVWTPKGLIYVAKMNDKGELELI